MSRAREDTIASRRNTNDEREGGGRNDTRTTQTNKRKSQADTYEKTRLSGSQRAGGSQSDSRGGFAADIVPAVFLAPFPACSLMSAPSTVKTVLVVGATGHLGGMVVNNLLTRGHRVRALVRPSTDPAQLLKRFPSLEIVRGDMMDRASLTPAFAGTDAVVTTAAGYMKRQKTDSIKTDEEGNRFLVDAAKEAGTGVFVLCSILTCDSHGSESVPHFHAKALTESYLREKSQPYVALRPGAFLMPIIFPTLKSDYIVGLWKSDAKITYITPSEVARCLALAVDEPRAINQAIDLGLDRPINNNDLVSIMSNQLGKKIKAYQLPRFIFSMMACFNGLMADMKAMADYFNTGVYVANTTKQVEFFGPAKTAEEQVRELLTEMKLFPGQQK